MHDLLPRTPPLRVVTVVRLDIASVRPFLVVVIARSSAVMSTRLLRVSETRDRDSAAAGRGGEGVKCYNLPDLGKAPPVPPRLHRDIPSFPTPASAPAVCLSM